MSLGANYLVVFTCFHFGVYCYADEVSEMPTSGDLKSGDFSFFPHPKKIKLGLPMFT